MSTTEEEMRAIRQAHMYLTAICSRYSKPALPKKYRQSAYLSMQNLDTLRTHSFYGFEQDQADLLATARNFLLSLLDPKQTPRVPSMLRDRAFQILKHFPLDGKATDYSLAWSPRYNPAEEISHGT